jgi:L-fucose mutarotase
MLLHSKLVHPEINGILGQAGHHSKVLICDGNYPASSKIGPEAELVSLNLSPGVVTCSQVLEALVTASPLDAVNTMGIRNWNRFKSGIFMMPLCLTITS